MYFRNLRRSNNLNHFDTESRESGCLRPPRLSLKMLVSMEAPIGANSAAGPYSLSPHTRMGSTTRREAQSLLARSSQWLRVPAGRAS
jgi:hypothetical protein